VTTCGASRLRCARRRSPACWPRPAGDSLQRPHPIRRRGDRVPARLQDGTRGDRVEAKGLALPLRSLVRLAQDGRTRPVRRCAEGQRKIGASNVATAPAGTFPIKEPDWRTARKAGIPRRLQERLIRPSCSHRVEPADGSAVYKFGRPCRSSPTSGAMRLQTRAWPRLRCPCSRRTAFPP
jgi:hypothetical protein